MFYPLIPVAPVEHVADATSRWLNMEVKMICRKKNLTLCPTLLTVSYQKHGNKTSEFDFFNARNMFSLQ